MKTSQFKIVFLLLKLWHVYIWNTVSVDAGISLFYFGRSWYKSPLIYNWRFHKGASRGFIIVDKVWGFLRLLSSQEVMVKSCLFYQSVAGTTSCGKSMKNQQLSKAKMCLIFPLIFQMCFQVETSHFDRIIDTSIPLINFKCW